MRAKVVRVASLEDAAKTLDAESPLAFSAFAADPIKIGVVTPLSGTYAGIGQQVRWGLELATKEVNAAGGVMGRRSAAVVRQSR